MTRYERKIAHQEERWQRQRDIQERKWKMRGEKQQLKNTYLTKRSTTKMLIAFLFINCTLIELFTGWTTIQSFKIAVINGISPDFTPLVTLIGAVVSEVIGFAIYAIKSAKENSVGGLIYEQAMANMQIGPEKPRSEEPAPPIEEQPPMEDEILPDAVG